MVANDRRRYSVVPTGTRNQPVIRAESLVRKLCSFAFLNKFNLVEIAHKSLFHTVKARHPELIWCHSV
jgi:hypothetical protein